jgi:hypothetical protein
MAATMPGVVKMPTPMTFAMTIAAASPGPRRRCSVDGGLTVVWDSAITDSARGPKGMFLLLRLAGDKQDALPQEVLGGEPLVAREQPRGG